jgi:phosphoribosylpyrophosphate synthetase
MRSTAHTEGGKCCKGCCTPEGCHCVIVDDLVQSGGTLQVCKKVLLQMGATKVSAFVTHPIFHSDKWKDFIDDGWTHIYVTDSIPETCAKLKGKDPFKVLSISSKVDEFLTRNLHNLHGCVA